MLVFVPSLPTLCTLDKSNNPRTLVSKMWNFKSKLLQFLVAKFQNDMNDTNLLNMQIDIKKNNYLTIVFISSH